MIQLEHVWKTYPPNYRALRDINLEIDQGEFVYLVGASGAGKSTFLRLLFRAEEPSAGDIRVDGQSLAKLKSRGVAALRRKIGLVFQEFKLLANLTVVDNVALAAQVTGASQKESRSKAVNLLRELGLNDRHDAKPLALSGGEQQRVAIARALINDPILVLADEPTGNLDAEVADETMRLFAKIRAQGATIILATHDLGLVNRYGTRVISLRRGELADDLSRGESGSSAQ
ncbi:MAG: cell division ATP-binding protein FtsE [Deltaproteobacteria bacterium]|nr:cell division ATP-binding protein FtsE [Deltaproteobacteria bacterium]